MNRSTFMTIAAIAAFLFGLAFIAAPAQTASMYGRTIDLAGQFIGRYLGSAFLGVAVLTWYARNTQDNETLGAILLGNFVLCLTGFFVALFDVFAGEGNALVWSTVVIYLLLGVGFGYFRFK
jgi:hypothetical protein